MLIHKPDSIKQKHEQADENLDLAEMLLQLQYEVELLKLGNEGQSSLLA